MCPPETLVHIRFMLTRKGESWNPYLVPDLREKAFSVSSLRMILAVGFSYATFIVLRKFPSVFHLLSASYPDREVNVVDGFSAPVDANLSFFFCHSAHDSLCF